MPFAQIIIQIGKNVNKSEKIFFFFINKGGKGT